MSEVEQYISYFEPEIQEKLNCLRQIFFEVLPDTEECLRYKMPAYKVGKHHLYFAAYKNHIGFYPVYGLIALDAELEQYRAKGTKDTIHFKHTKPLPIELIKSIIKLKAEIV